jgi:hypothetical protein
MSLHLEVLEPRLLLSGNAFQLGGDVFVAGGFHEADTIVLRGRGPGIVDVYADPAGLDDVVGTTPIASFTGVAQVAVSTFGGNDVVVIDGVQLAGGLAIGTGNGHDTVLIRNSSDIGGDLGFDTHLGNDVVSVENSSVGDDISLSAHYGHDLFTLDNTRVTDQVTIAAGYGNDVVRIANSPIGGASTISMGVGRDTVIFHETNVAVGPGSRLVGGSVSGIDTLAVESLANLPIANVSTPQFERRVEIANLPATVLAPFDASLADRDRRIAPLIA